MTGPRSDRGHRVRIRLAALERRIEPVRPCECRGTGVLAGLPDRGAYSPAAARLVEVEQEIEDEVARQDGRTPLDLRSTSECACPAGREWGHARLVRSVEAACDLGLVQRLENAVMVRERERDVAERDEAEW